LNWKKLPPFLGMPVGAAMVALSGKFTDYGIDDGFNKSVSDKVTEGNLAFFLMTSGAVIDKVCDAEKEIGWKFYLISSNLTRKKEQQCQLNRATL